MSKRLATCPQCDSTDQVQRLHCGAGDRCRRGHFGCLGCGRRFVGPREWEEELDVFVPGDALEPEVVAGPTQSADFELVLDFR